YRRQRRGGAANDHDVGASFSNGGSRLHGDAHGHRRDTALHLGARERHAARPADAHPEHGGDHGHADRGWHRELHGARDRGGAERDQSPPHHGDRGVLHHLARQSGPGDRGRGGPGGGGAGRQVPGRRRRDHHRHPLLQERGQHGDPPRQPVDDRRGEARDGDLHGRDGGGL